MDSGSIYQLLTPIFCFAFSAAFFSIYLYRRKKISIALFGLSYLAGGMAFVTDIFRENVSELTASLAINSLYLLTLIFLVAAIAKHFGKSIPYIPIFCISAATFAGMVWFLTVDYSIAARTGVMNFGSGMLLLPALTMVPRKNCAPIYKAIFWILVISFLQFYIRTALTFHFSSEPLSMANYRDSLYLVAFHFSIAIVSVGLALTLCIAIGMEEITDLQQLSMTDFLSGLVNRRGFEEEAIRQIELFHSSKVPLSLIVCDIDHFKKVNDAFGHDAGDRIIKGFGNIIKRNCRSTDLVARIGGEEFCVLLPVATKEMAVLVANAARLAFNEHSFGGIPANTRFTASFGVAQIVPGDGYLDLFKRADAALYQAKQTGRNKVVLSADQITETKAIGMNARKPRTA